MVWLSPDDLYPVEITACKDAPAVPPRPAPDAPRTSEDKAKYDVELRGAWADCYDTVGDVAKRKERYKLRFDQAQAGPLGKLWRNVTGKNREIE